MAVRPRAAGGRGARAAAEAAGAAVLVQLCVVFRILDRYILRETLPLVSLSLLVFTFLLLIPPIMEVAQELIAKGVDTWTVAQLLLTLLPQGLGITIPAAVLIGLLMGLGRMSGDREIVVLQACGVSIQRLLRPVITLAALAAAATCYTLIVLLPDANQAYRDIVYRTVAAATDDLKARVFDENLPDVVLYVNEVDVQGTGWSGVFLADTREEGAPQIYVADEGRIVLDPENRQVDIVLTSGAAHEVDGTDPAGYNVNRFDEIVIGLDPDEVFEAGSLQRGLREMTIAELREHAAELESAGISPHNPIMEIHQKFALPVACLVFAFISLALGVTSRKDGKLASFGLSIGVIFAYYVLLFGGQGLARAALVSPHWAVWICNIVLGAFGVLLLVWRARFGERRMLPPLPRLRRGVRSPAAAGPAPPVTPEARPGRGVTLGTGLGWGPGLLDRYVAKQYLQLATLSFVGFLGIFYLVTFLEISDRLFRGDTTLDVVLEYFWYATPQFVYYVLPISALVSTLVSVGLLTKTSELTVMKACGISLYRVSLPLVLFALLWSGALFGMSESFLADANRRANELNRIIRGGSPQHVDILQRRWLMGEDGTIYHYGHFDPAGVTLHGLTTYRFADGDWRLAEIRFAGTAVHDDGWLGRDVWVREFGPDRSPGAFRASPELPLAIVAPEAFATERPDAERMNYQELDGYIAELSASGVDVAPLRVELQRKLSFPFVTLVLTLIAIPFAITTGRHGALSGVGIGIVLALAYWVVVSMFAAIGSAGILAPLLAAWAPNVLFGGSALYLLLAART